MAERQAGTPLNDALNRPKRKLGIDWRLFAAIAGGAALTAIFVNLILGLALLLALPPLVRYISRRDAQMFKLWALSFLQKAHYDPGKAAR
jgi:type IV secretory pathway VirB3-like protein